MQLVMVPMRLRWATILAFLNRPPELNFLDPTYTKALLPLYLIYWAWRQFVIGSIVASNA